MAKTEQVFVNLQNAPVSVYDPDRRRVTLVPWEKRDRPGLEDAVFEVRGDHYAQFVGPRGPLFPRPQAPAPVPPVAESAPPSKSAPPATGDEVPPPVEETDGKKAPDKSEAGGAPKAVAPPTDWHAVEKGAAVTAVWRDKKWNGAFVSPIGEEAQKLRISLDGDDAKYREVRVNKVELVQLEP